MKPRVLIFEDNDALRKTLKQILNELSYEVHTFSNPGMCPQFYSSSQGCSLVDSCSDIIISDVNMPVENGIEFIKRRLDNGCKLKFRALMSADWNETDIQRAKNLGCKVFHKPFELEALIRWLDSCRKQIDHKRALSDWSIK